MTRLRDHAEDFRGAVQAAAQELGLAAEFVEKDYWVTQVLRALHERYAAGFLLKGGTSLAKGYDLIERFSEDVDVLVTPTSGDSAASRERRLRAMTGHVADALGLEWEAARPPGRGRQAHRADVLRYPRSVRQTLAVATEARGVLLETGYSEGEWPSEMVTLTPMLCSPLDLDPAEYEDTSEFQVRALKPMRTLLEKLSLLHHTATCFARDAASADRRCGRHYYDIYRLLDHPPTRTALDDRDQVERILVEMEAISTAQYGGWSARPERGYGHSPAFTNTGNSELRAWLQARYDDAEPLLPATPSSRHRWPTFGRVLKRVERHSHLL